MSFSERLRLVRGRIAQAAERAGRDPNEVTLVGVSKTKPVAALQEALADGLVHFGENRVQELTEKQKVIPTSPPVWHFIGRLQRNKARDVVGQVALIHAVESERLLLELEKRAAEQGCRQSVLLQLNLSGEQSKAGVSARDLEALLRCALGCKHIDCDGLMTMPPPVDHPDDNRRYFRELHRLRLQHGLRHASMGMTNDFEVAIEEGATLVRVGTALFGGR